MSSGAVKGAVLLLGSLFWEGNEPGQDGDKGRRRKKWRDTRLEMKTCRDIPVPIRYGRRSDSRSGEFTIVLGGQAGGLAKVANLQRVLAMEKGAFATATEKLFEEEVFALAEAEGIFKNRNEKKASTDWGRVSIAINPRSRCKEALRELWVRKFPAGNAFDPAPYGKDLLDKEGVLSSSFLDESWQDLDFFLATLTKPDDDASDPKDIAIAIKLGSYFRRTRASGIKTPEDEQIMAHLLELGPTPPSNPRA